MNQTYQEQNSLSSLVVALFSLRFACAVGDTHTPETWRYYRLW